MQQRTYLIFCHTLLSLLVQSNWIIYLLVTVAAWHPLVQSFSIWINVLEICWMEKCTGVEPMNWKAHLWPDPVKHRMSPVSGYSFSLYFPEKSLCLSANICSIVESDINKHWFWRMRMFDIKMSLRLAFFFFSRLFLCKTQFENMKK